MALKKALQRCASHGKYLQHDKVIFNIDFLSICFQANSVYLRCEYETLCSVQHEQDKKQTIKPKLLHALAASYQVTVPWQHIQVRGRYANWQMLRDVKRRACVKEHAQERLRINAIRKNTVLPPVIQEMATREIQKFPVDSNQTRLVKRCVMTSRPRNVRKHWRLSRIMWRHLADYNKLSGVTRSTW
ncbi:hypothetical protein LSH36_139g04017 [Paralvinella palmiformis]|uniref:28S ribosomal protein S14, mitochondrial n=1 Tax=Paralvinella palmiformis TaxID=53620 RepID=A0AAD9JVL1_9ANNE|nr:hypothetical protein LSH36_139g04017 [Paralvinella palmiformis]